MDYECYMYLTVLSGIFFDRSSGENLVFSNFQSFAILPFFFSFWKIVFYKKVRQYTNVIHLDGIQCQWITDYSKPTHKTYIRKNIVPELQCVFYKEIFKSRQKQQRFFLVWIVLQDITRNYSPFSSLCQLRMHFLICLPSSHHAPHPQRAGTKFHPIKVCACKYITIESILCGNSICNLYAAYI